MKKSKPKKEQPDASIHFRPGHDLGKLIGDFADVWQTSRGEAAKRLVALASHGLDLAFAPIVQELSTYMYGSASFDEACDMIHLTITEAEREAGDNPLPYAKRLDAAKQRVELYRLMRGCEEVAERTRVQIKLYRTQ